MPRFAASLFIVVVSFRRCSSAAPDHTRRPPPRGFSPTDGGPQTRSGRNIGDWCQLATIALEDRSSAVYGHLASVDDLRDHFLDAELRLTTAFLLVKQLDGCLVSADEVIICQLVRK